MAVGVIIGAAFGKIVTSVIEDLIMPVVARLTGGGMDFSNLYLSLSDKIPAGTALVEAKKLGPVIAYGNFITIAINFLILAFIIFMMIRAMNRMMKKEEAKPAPPPGPTNEEKLLTEIRDAIRAR
jgi:large conductance mechanosensitive channel